MSFRLTPVLGALALVLSAQAAFAQTAIPPLPDDIKPIRTSGVGLKVSNLEKSKAFYTEVLGMKVDAKVPATGNGPVREYLLGFTGNTQVDTLVVLSEGKVEAGATTFGRIVLVVPNGRKMAERVIAAGYPTGRPLVDGTNIIKDPDGYVIELYQRPAPRPAG